MNLPALMATILAPCSLLASAPADWRDNLPRPVIDAHPEYLTLWSNAWQIAHTRIDTIPGLPAPRYMDEAHRSDRLWIWDTCFMAHFCKYLPDEFPGIQSLDNLYGIVLAPDGKPLPKVLGNKWCGDQTGKWLDLTIHHPDNPPLFAWTEYTHALQTGDRKRLEMVWERRYLQRWFDLFESFRPGMPNPHGTLVPVKACRHQDGFSWEGCASGMDNTPRGRKGTPLGGGVQEYHEFPDALWVDALAQQALSALYIARIAELLGHGAEARSWKARHATLAAQLNALYYDAEDGWYYDIRLGSREKIKVRTIASYWPVLAEAPDRQMFDRMAAELENPETFGGVVPTPSLARNDGDFQPSGGYWRGSVWLPTSYMAIKALDCYGDYERARRVAERIVGWMARAWREDEPSTIWECYSPTRPAGATCDGIRKVRTDFCGWSALGPISLLIEDVIGIKRADAFARTLLCHFPKTIEGRLGVENYRFGTIRCSVVATSQKIAVESNDSFVLTVDGRAYEVKPGVQTFPRR